MPSTFSIVCIYLLYYSYRAERKDWKKGYINTLVILVILCFFLQLFKSLNVGFQEYNYRAGIGRWLAKEAKSDDTLMLEPAGYIPYFSGLRTYDEVGLVSSEVLRYLKAYGHDWWPNFVKDYCPTYIVEREALVTGAETGSKYILKDVDESFLVKHYALEKIFHYRPEDYTSNLLLLFILKYGSHSDYYLYTRFKNCRE